MGSDDPRQAVEVKDVAKSFEELLSAVGPSDVFVWLGRPSCSITIVFFQMTESGLEWY